MPSRIIMLGALAGAAVGAAAQEVAIRFTGEITGIRSLGNADFSDDFFIGGGVVGFFTLDLSVADIDDTGSAGVFPGALVDLGVQIDAINGRVGLDLVSAATVSVFDDTAVGSFPEGDYVSSVLDVAGRDIDGVGVTDSLMVLGDFKGEALDGPSTGSLSPVYDFNLFPELGLEFRWRAPGRGGETTGGDVEVGLLAFEVLGDCGPDPVIERVSDYASGAAISGFTAMDRGAGTVALKSTDDLTGQNPDGSDELFLLDLGSGVTAQITDDSLDPTGGPSLSFTADGRTLALTAFDSGGDIGLYFYDLDSQAFQLLLEPDASEGEGFGIATVTDDGSRVGFSGFLLEDTDPATAFANPGLHDQLYVYDVGTGVVTQLTQFDACCVLGDHVLSPNGAFFLFESDEDLAPGSNPGLVQQVFRLDVATGQISQLTSNTEAFADHFNIADPIVSADGRFVALRSSEDPVGQNPGNGEQVFVLDQSTMGIQQWTSGAGNEISQINAISADGAVVLFESESDIAGLNAEGPTELFRATADAIERVTDFPPDSGENFQVRLGNNGRTAMFRSGRAPLPCLPASGAQIYTATFLPGLCPADFDGDGSVNVLDVVAFITNWNAQGPGADFDGDGSINVLDVVAFIQLWNAGCA